MPPGTHNGTDQEREACRKTLPWQFPCILPFRQGLSYRKLADFGPLRTMIDGCRKSSGLRYCPVITNRIPYAYQEALPLVRACWCTSWTKRRGWSVSCGSGTVRRTVSATVLASPRASLAASGYPRILPPAKSPCRAARGGPPATAPLLPRDFPRLSIMAIRRCCGAACEVVHHCRPVMTSDKFRPHHLERKALLYVR